MALISIGLFSPPHAVALRVQPNMQCVSGATMVTLCLVVIDSQTAVQPSLKHCLPVPLDSDPEVCHPANCFLRTHTEQTEPSGTMTLATDICSLGPFMAALSAIVCETAEWAIQPCGCAYPQVIATQVVRVVSIDHQ